MSPQAKGRGKVPRRTNGSLMETACLTAGQSPSRPWSAIRPGSTECATEDAGYLHPLRQRYAESKTPSSQSFGLEFRGPRRLIQIELVLVILGERRVLHGFVEHAIADSEHLHLRAHEAPKCIFGRAHDGLAADVEARIDQHGTARAPLEGGKQSMVPRIGFGVHGLDPGRIVDVSNGRDLGADDVELVDAEEMFLLGAHAPAAV